MFHNYQKLTIMRIGSYLLVQYLILLVFFVVVTYWVTREAMVGCPSIPTQINNVYLSSYMPIL